jgi:hypothetical protein
MADQRTIRKQRLRRASLDCRFNRLVVNPTGSPEELDGDRGQSRSGDGWPGKQVHQALEKATPPILSQGKEPASPPGPGLILNLVIELGALLRAIGPGQGSKRSGDGEGENGERRRAEGRPFPSGRGQHLELRRMTSARPGAQLRSLLAFRAPPAARMGKGPALVVDRESAQRQAATRRGEIISKNADSIKTSLLHRRWLKLVDIRDSVWGLGQAHPGAIIRRIIGGRCHRSPNPPPSTSVLHSLLLECNFPAIWRFPSLPRE